jgi:ABC-type multidrug transport system fused ATPase/permease subunit
LKQAIKNILIILTAREKKRGWLLAIADACISMLDIFFLLVLLYLLRFYTQPAPGINNRFTAVAIFTAYPLLPVLIFFILFTLKNAAGFFVAKMQCQFVYHVASRISEELMERYLNGDYTAYVSIDSSVVNRGISQEPVEFAHYVLNGMQQIFSQCILVVITLLAICLLNPLLIPLLMLVLVPPFFLVQRLVKRKLNAARQHGKQTSEHALQHLQEGLLGFIESNIYQKNNFFTARYHRLQVKLNHYLSTRLIIQYLPPRLMEVFAIFGLLLLVLANAILGNGHSIGLVTIGALMVAAYKIIPGIVKIGNLAGQVKTYSFVTGSLAAVANLHTKREYNNETIEMLACSDIVFGYPEKNVFNQFSACFQKCDFAIVTGASGKGKTTLVHLLLGFLSPASGTISFNKKSTDAVSRQAYWTKIAYIKQQAFFLHASIIENICLQEDNYDAARMAQVLAMTGLSGLIDLLPEGANHIITENGKNFSGGQRQRIAFARALYKDFDLLVLDEPFNELDEASERDMLLLLQQVAADGKIVILVTHSIAAMEFGNKKITVT